MIENIHSFQSLIPVWEHSWPVIKEPVLPHVIMSSRKSGKRGEEEKEEEE